MKTHFASPERASEAELQDDIEQISRNPVIDGLMNVASGLFAVLNQHRQVIAVNETFLSLLGVKDVHDIIGLRPGETLNCIHANKNEGGCGTSEYCPTCGAAIAIVLSLEKEMPVEKICAVEVERNGKRDDLCFRVRALPVKFSNRPIVLLFLQDITHQQKLDSLEKIFFHDISNIVSGLVNSSNSIKNGKPEKKERALDRIHTLVERLAGEISVQRQLILSNIHTYQPSLHELSVARLFKELESVLTDHPEARGKEIIFEGSEFEFTFNSDLSLLVRILSNMIINALEASSENDVVRVWVEDRNDRTIFKVWNKSSIPLQIAKRVFQRNYSTKRGAGRGLGTYSMKILSEKFLGGEVDFSSSEKKGTEFVLSICKSNSKQ